MAFLSIHTILDFNDLLYYERIAWKMCQAYTEICIKDLANFKGSIYKNSKMPLINLPYLILNDQKEVIKKPFDLDLTSSLCNTFNDVKLTNISKGKYNLLYDYN